MLGLARRFQIAMPIEISYNYFVNKKANVREHVSPNVLENRQCLHFKLIKVLHHLRVATHKDGFSFLVRNDWPCSSRQWGKQSQWLRPWPRLRTERQSASRAVHAEQRQDLLSRRHLDVGLTLMDPFHNDGKRRTFFQLLHWHRSLRKAKHRQCSLKKYYTIIGSAVSWLDFFVNFLKLIW